MRINKSKTLYESFIDNLKESYAIVGYYKGLDIADDKVFNGKSPKEVENKVRKFAEKDGIEIDAIEQVSYDLANSKYLNSLGKGIRRVDFNSSTFEESNINEAVEYNIMGDKVIVDKENKKLNVNGKEFTFDKMDEFVKKAKGANRMYKPMALLLYTDMKNGKISNWNKYKVNNINEAESSKHKVPDYAKECIEDGIYDSRGFNLRSAMFDGNTLVVESKDELTEELFDKIVKLINSYFNSYGVYADGGFEDDGNKVLAIDCYMTEEGYKEYLANSDEDNSLVINGQTFNDKSDAKTWLDEKIEEYGNTYFFPSEEKRVLNKLIEKFGNTYFWK